MVYLAGLRPADKIHRVSIRLASKLTKELSIVTIGIGAGPDCDAQWLVMHDLLGLNDNVPKFAKKYASIADNVRDAFYSYVQEVSSGVFPPKSDT